MRVLVTGASGNIGSAVVRELSAAEHEVLAVARRRPVVPRTTAHSTVEWRCVDVSRDDLDDLVAGVDAVVHLAWKMQPTHRPEETWATNAVGTRRLLDAMARSGTPALVCVSSVAAYSPVTHDDPVDETWQTDGASSAAYCREKAYVERILDAYEAASPGPRTVRIRPAFVFQRSAASEQRRIFGGPLARPAMFERRRIPVLPVPSGLRFQAVHAGDVARAVCVAVTRPVSGAYNLAGGGILDRPALGELVGARTFPVPPRVVRHAIDAAWTLRAAPVPGDLFSGLMGLPIMSTERARADLGWTPQHTGPQALAALFEGAAARAGSGLPPLQP
ncbi:NAD-dependent epimerase/dehydratase family protein [Nocardioides sp. LHG3406-4]|uniref:NAD-dependent epimerase/dehydratase family protein n=1 Tax=Nocardioides sp. LHG3406-4 TaxID=2804575 RepID=UPI003CE791D0